MTPHPPTFARRKKNLGVSWIQNIASIYLHFCLLPQEEESPCTVTPPLEFIPAPPPQFDNSPAESEESNPPSLEAPAKLKGAPPEREEERPAKQYVYGVSEAGPKVSWFGANCWVCFENVWVCFEQFLSWFCAEFLKCLNSVWLWFDFFYIANCNLNKVWVYLE